MIRTLLALFLLLRAACAFAQDLVVALPLTAMPVYRVAVQASPPVLRVDFQEPVLNAVDLAVTLPSDLSFAVETAEDGWERVKIPLLRPHKLVSAALLQDGNPKLHLVLAPLAEVPAKDDTATEPVTPPPPAVIDGPTLPVIALDPGHGGIDAGAVRDGLREADLMLSFARSLRETLIRTGRFRVMLTRDDDIYLRLGQRVSRARAAGAMALISLHADALEDGRASGAIIYTLSEEASDAVAAELVELHDRTDILGGLDLSDEEDAVTAALVDLARAGTDPAARALSEALLAAMEEGGVDLQATPDRSAAFRVLKAADIPSVLVELGFMSDKKDLENLRDPEWREQAAEAVAAGIVNWADVHLTGK
ncbi:MAG: N-acetylmuramoyl-L-alanine amidase [Pseudomonadota bacterium]